MVVPRFEIKIHVIICCTVKIHFESQSNCFLLICHKAVKFPFNIHTLYMFLLVFWSYQRGPPSIVLQVRVSPQVQELFDSLDISLQDPGRTEDLRPESQAVKAMLQTRRLMPAYRRPGAYQSQRTVSH